MMDWGYWRWQVLRNLPLAMVLLAGFSFAIWSAVSAMPSRHYATARLVLERPIGVSETPKLQRNAEDIQHLQIVSHSLKSKIRPETVMAPEHPSAPPAANEGFALKIESDRGKPTYLEIKAEASDPILATALATQISDQAIEHSAMLQQARVEVSLAKLRDQLVAQKDGLKRAQQEVSAYGANVPSHTPSELRVLAAQLRSQASSLAVERLPESPVLAKLNVDLAVAKGLYSDLHPKVRLIRSRISQELSQQKSSELDDATRFALAARLSQIEVRIETADAAFLIQKSLEQDVAVATTGRNQALTMLNAAQLRAEANSMHLKEVQTATLENDGGARKRMALFVVLALAALLVTMGAIWLRIRTDQRLRRPVDLKRTLGITPFATLPDLGPSLG